MSPTEPQTMEQPTILINGQALPSQPERVQTTQPKVSAPMGTWKPARFPPPPPPKTPSSSSPPLLLDRPTEAALELTWHARPRRADPQRPHADYDDGANIRGGERSGMCPGRFCFIIPCPLPCDCCII